MEFSIRNVYLILWHLIISETSAGVFAPGELVSALSLVYSWLPPTKIGTDSRLGFGFRIGRNADAQFLFELGPQSNTIPLQTNNNNKRDINSNIENSFSGIWKNIFTNRYKYNLVTHSPNLPDKSTPIPTTPISTSPSTTEESFVFNSTHETTHSPIDLPVYLSDKFLVNNRVTGNKSSHINNLELINKYKNIFPVFSINVFKLVNSLKQILPDL